MPTMFRKHHISALLAAALAFAAAVPTSAQTPSKSKVEAAYMLSIKCFVAGGHASEDRLDANDLEGASRYDGNAKKAHDVANKLGSQLGYSKAKIDDDFDTVMNRELPRLMSEPGYFAKVAGECRAYGLM